MMMQWFLWRSCLRVLFSMKKVFSGDLNGRGDGDAHGDCDDFGVCDADADADNDQCDVDGDGDSDVCSNYNEHCNDKNVFVLHSVIAIILMTINLILNGQYNQDLYKHP